MKSIKFAKLIYSWSKKRIELAVTFLTFRPYLHNWDEYSKLEDIKFATNEEITCRYKDSFWRSLDLYTILFGRTLPVILILIAATFFQSQIGPQLTIVLWISAPLISLIMEFGRFVSDYSLAKLAYKEIQDNTTLEQNKDFTIVLNTNWEIWDGTLYENILKELSPVNLDLCKELRIFEEFSSIDKNYLQVQLKHLGKNISQGQKTRILLIRAIHLAIAEKRPLYIKISLESLDPIVCGALYKVLLKLKPLVKINLTKEQEEFIKLQTSRIKEYKNQNYLHVFNNKIEDISDTNKVYESDLKSFFYYYKALMSNLSMLFLLPAFLLSLNGYIINDIQNTLIMILILTLIALFSIPFVSFVGCLIENKNRNRTASFQMNLLLNAALENYNDLLQRISKDFTVMVERISWYVHDIAWYQSLIFITFISVILTAGFVGVITNTVFVILILIICRLFANLISETRSKAVVGVNHSISYLSALSTINTSPNSVVSKIRKEWCYSGFNVLFNTYVNALVAKSVFSNLISVMTGVFIIIISLFIQLYGISSSYSVFVLTSLLAMENVIVSLFQALTGLNSQILSYKRLETFPSEQIKSRKDTIVFKDTTCIIKECINPVLQTVYKSIILKIGACYSLVGPSGSGKTQFLNTVSNIYNSTISEPKSKTKNNKVLYLDRKTIEILEWLNIDSLIKFIRLKIIEQGYKLIIMDELLCNYKLSHSKKIIAEIKNILIKYKAVLLIVDHRFEVENQISINKVLKVDKVRL